MARKLLLIDGYNVLRSGDYYDELRDVAPDYADEAFNAARDALINDVAVFAGHEYDAVVVFDGAGNIYSDGRPTRVGGVEVVFSSAGVTADSVIEERAKQAQSKGIEVLVVTSDAATQWTVYGRSVNRMSAAGFYEELRSIAAASASEAAIAHKYTLGDRLPPDVLKRLRERFG